MHATLLFVERGDELLLIRKKRGLGAGLVNGPGGKIDPGETPEQAAVREVIEEVGVTPTAPRWVGRLRFQFGDGLRLQVEVFRSPTFSGTPCESPEALPFWCPKSAIPYEEMWADDREWIPHMLAGKTVYLDAVFDGQVMLSHTLELSEDRNPRQS
jgi:8-oxo-dGTP diphosphatase